MAHEMHDVETEGRLLAKIVRELLRTVPCESLPDFTDALKVRCARLRIRWSNDGINDAYRMIRSNTPLPGDSPPPRVLVERPPEPEIVSRVRAAQLLAALRGGARRMPAVRRTTPFDRDRVTAAQMLAAEIVASIARCEALESEKGEATP